MEESTKGIGWRNANNNRAEDWINSTPALLELIKSNTGNIYELISVPESIQSPYKIKAIAMDETFDKEIKGDMIETRRDKDGKNELVLFRSSIGEVIKGLYTTRDDLIGDIKLSNKAIASNLVRIAYKLDRRTAGKCPWNIERCNDNITHYENRREAANTSLKCIEKMMDELDRGTYLM